MNDLLEKLAQGGLSEEEEQELKDKIEELQEKMEELEGQAREQSESLDDQLEERGYDIRSAMGEAMTEALGKAQGMANLGMVWGSEPGEFKKMDPQQRLELSKKIDNPRFRQLAELIGPMIHMAIGAQRDKVHYVPEEIYDIELGNDLTRITTSEWINMGHPILRYDFMRRFMEHGLTQRVMRGTEKQAKGGIIACTDGSGSMSGMKEIWAMAVTLALLRIARNQKRPFTGIQFGSAGIYKRWVFDTTAKTLKVTIDESGVEGTRTLEGVEAVLDYASTFLCGGTDFMTPFNLAIEQLTTEHTEKGAVDGDIVFITDGECSVTTEWEEKYFETQEALGFKTFGIAIGCSPTSQPLAKLCDNQVTGVTDLVASNAPKSIFGMV